jgi:ribonuclease P protein component
MGMVPTISKSRHVKRVMNGHGKISCKSFVFFYAPREADAVALGAEFAFMATSKLGGAVVRNRVKRRLRVLTRDCLLADAAGFSCVLLARHAMLDMGFADVRKEFLYVARRMRRDAASSPLSKNSSI